MNDLVDQVSGARSGEHPNLVDNPALLTGGLPYLVGYAVLPRPTRAQPSRSSDQPGARQHSQDFGKSARPRPSRSQRRATAQPGITASQNLPEITVVPLSGPQHGPVTGDIAVTVRNGAAPWCYSVIDNA